MRDVYPPDVMAALVEAGRAALRRAALRRAAAFGDGTGGGYGGGTVRARSGVRGRHSSR